MTEELQQQTIFKCQGCGKNLPKGRRDRKYHNAACRMKAKRWRDKMITEAANATRSIRNVAKYLENPDTDAAAYKRLRALERFAHETILKFERERGLRSNEN